MPPSSGSKCKSGLLAAWLMLGSSSTLKMEAIRSSNVSEFLSDYTALYPGRQNSFRIYCFCALNNILEEPRVTHLTKRSFI
jgi:hypothetical protein